MGWSGVKNGKLLRLADGKFDVLITLDSNILYQNDFTGLSVSVVTLLSKQVSLNDLLPMVPNVLMALSYIKPGQIVNIERN